MKHLHLSLLLMLSAILTLSAAEPVKLGITQADADQFRFEFEQYGRLAPFYRKHNILASLVEYNTMIRETKSTGALAGELRRFHVVLLQSQDEGIFTMTGGKKKHAEEVGTILADYVRSGGGLVIDPSPVRYPGNDDEKYWNIIFGKFGFKLEREGLFDRSTAIQHEYKTSFTAQFFHTSNIAVHPATAGVRGLWLPVFSFVPYAGTPLVSYDHNWEIIVRGNQTAATYQTPPDNSLNLTLPGSIRNAPPVCAVRSFGKGRVAVLAVDKIHCGQNIGIPTWSHIVENRGAAGRPGDLMKLQTNLIHWCAAPAVADPSFGTYKAEKYEKITYPESVEWDHFSFHAPRRNRSCGIIGAHSNFAGGRSTVRQYVTAAQKIGLQFIVFTDPLEKMTREKFNAMKKACEEVSSDQFYACPGVEFTDGAGIRRIFFGPKVEWPEDKILRKNNFSHKLWDGKIIRHYGWYSTQCSYPGSAIINYADLKKNGVRPENLWWFFHIIPYAYDNGRLIADNSREYDFALQDLRQVAPISFTRIHEASQVKSAADLAISSAESLSAVRQMLSTRCTPYYLGKRINQQVSYGKGHPVMIRNFQAINDQADPRVLKTRGTQRIRLNFAVFSPHGIREVRIHDGGLGILRRFTGSGTKEFSRTFELVHDRQHDIYLVAEDLQGNMAISHDIRLFDYKQGLFRCGDNLNILGPLGYYWHPDRHQMLPLFKTFRNAELNSVQGWDRGGPDCPVPHGQTVNQIRVNGIGEVLPYMPDRRYSMQMKVALGSGDLQIVNAVMDSIVEGWDNSHRPGPAQSSPLKKISDNPWFIHRQRMYSARDRKDHHIAWDHRRLSESLKDYDGSFQMFEGEIIFRKDTVLDKQAKIPVELALLRTEPHKAMAFQNDIILVHDKKLGELAIRRNKGSKQPAHGEIAPDGYAAMLSSSVGYIGILPLQGDFRYYYHSPGLLHIGIGTPGKQYKAGEKLRYAYISGDFIDRKQNTEKIRLASSILHEGGHPLRILSGTLVSRKFFLTVSAAGHHASFIAGPRPGLGIDLPIRITGLQNNGCLAVYSSTRPWFRFIGTAADDGAAYFQEPIEKENRIWAGNIFVASSPSIRLTLVQDGQQKNRTPFLEIHNPTDSPLTVKISSPDSTPLYGGTRFTVAVPAGDSVFCSPDGKILNNRLQ